MRELCAFGERLGATALAAADYISSQLTAGGCEATVYDFPTAVPVCESLSLVVDGTEIPALNCSFVGGSIDRSAEVISSLQSSRNHFTIPNINSNERCSGLSTPNYYAAPAFAVCRDNLERVRAAHSITGVSVVRRTDTVARQILVGNTRAPRVILFSHFDSLFTGAVDNASGTAVMLHLALERPDLLRDNLFVFDGNEELSYDAPTYWGHGYRIFESRFGALLDSAARLGVIDCVGFEPTLLLNDPETLRVAFPLARAAELAPKTTIFAGSLDGLMPFYHSPLDEIDRLSEDHLRAAAARVAAFAE